MSEWPYKVVKNGDDVLVQAKSMEGIIIGIAAIMDGEIPEGREASLSGDELEDFI